MKPIMACLLAAFLGVAILGACSEDSGDNGPLPTAITTGTNGSATLQLVITNDSSMVDLEDEELSPILERIAPVLEANIANSDLPEATVQFIPPRSISIQIEGDAATIIPRIQQLITEGTFEIPLLITQLPSQ